MGAQNGKDLLVKVDLTGDGQFETMAGLRATRVSFNAESVDVTTLESQGGWRELLAGAGLRWVRVRGRGLFKDAASDERMRAVFMGGELCRFRLTVPGLGELTGPFQISQLGWGGTHDGEATFSIDLQSAGAISFEAAS